MENLVGVLIGGLVAAVAGLIGLSINKKTEHSQWLRDKKLEVYSEVSAHLDGLLHSATQQIRGVPTDSDRSVAQVIETSRQLSRLTMIAPWGVNYYAVEAERAVADLAGMDAEQFKAAEGRTIVALKIMKHHAHMDLLEDQDPRRFITRTKRYFARRFPKRTKQRSS